MNQQVERKWKNDQIKKEWKRNRGYLLFESVAEKQLRNWKETHLKFVDLEKVLDNIE